MATFSRVSFKIERYMWEKIKSIKKLLIKAARKYGKEDPIRLAGSTAFFMMFAISPILIIIISAAGLVMDDSKIREKVYQEIETVVGEKGTQQVKEIVSNLKGAERSLIGTIVGIVIFLIAATTFFTVLQKSLNQIWRIRAKPEYKFLKMLKDRLLSFGLIVSFGLIMLVSLLIDAGLSFLKDYLSDLFPELMLLVVRIINFAVSFAVVTLSFALVYKFLPDGKIKWKVTWIGSIVTAILFTIGKFIIGYALGASNIGVMYGAAGSLVIILLWVFYASIIFFFGAEITQQYAEMYSEKIVPKDYAVEIKIKEVDE